MLKGFQILETIDKYDKLPRIDHGMIYHSDSLVHDMLFGTVGNNDELYVYSSQRGCYNIKIGYLYKSESGSRYKEKESFEINIGEFTNYKRTKLIDKMLCQKM
jgi:hypothetical protein